MTEPNVAALEAHIAELEAYCERKRAEFSALRNEMLDRLAAKDEEIARLKALGSGPAAVDPAALREKLLALRALLEESPAPVGPGPVA